MASDPELADLAENAVREQGIPAPRAVWDAANTFRDLLAGAGGYVGARASDVEDVRNRIVGELLGVPAPGIPDPGHPFILVARDLAPADTATINPERVLAFVTAEGGPTSHTAILARALGIPAVVSCPEVLAITEGTVLVLDGATGTIDPAPDEATVTEARDRAARRRSPQPALGRPGVHRRRTSGQAARQHRRRGGRPGRCRCRSRGCGAVPHRVPVPRPGRRTVGVGADRVLRGRLRRVRRGHQDRRTHPGRRRGQAAAVPRPGRGGQSRPRCPGPADRPRAARGPRQAAARHRGGCQQHRTPTCG